MFLLAAEWEYRKRGGYDGSGIRIIYLLPAATQARKTVVARFQSKLFGQFAYLGGKFNLTTLRAEFHGGSWIQFASAEQGELIRGIRADAAFVDECDDIDREMYSAVVAPWLSEPFSLKRAMLGGTPMRGRHGLLYQSYCLGRDQLEGYFGVHATWRDAPEHVDAEYVQRERRVAEIAGMLATFEREWECNFDAGEGLVFPMFSRELHVREPHKDAKFSEILVGVDHGWEDPGVFEIAGVCGNGNDASLHFLDEVYQKGRVESWWVEQAKQVLKTYPNAKWYCDPSRPDRIQALRNAGCRIQETDNSIEPGISAMSNRLAPRETNDGVRFARFYISPKCKEFIREMGLYRRKRDSKNKDQFLDETVDRDNHTIDAARYLTIGRFGKPQVSRGMGNF